MEQLLQGLLGPGEGSPPEWIDYVLMKRMGWTFDQVQATPAYVKRYCLDFMRLEAAAAEMKREEAALPPGAQVYRHGG